MLSMTSQNEILFERAQLTTPGGVNSPVRAFKSVGGTPRFISKANGACFWDADGKRYIDYIGSWGPMVVGHAHPVVVETVQQACTNGFSFGAPTLAEIEMAEEICRLMPSIQQVRLVSSGTEATMSAIRLARGYTKRDKIIKFEGCYHGHADALLVKAGSGLLTFGNPTSAGVPQDFAKHTLVLEYNNTQQLQEIFTEYAGQIAAVIVEPIAGNMNLIRAAPEFLSTMRALCDRDQTILIFDEVMTGFRVGLGGAQALYEIDPDLTTLGKIIGGGLPVAAFGGRKEIMQHLAPIGNVYQAGTLSGNPIAVAAGLATLKLVQTPDFYTYLSQQTLCLTQGLCAAAQIAGIDFCADAVGGMFGLYFAKEVPRSYAAMLNTDVVLFNRFFHSMLEQGVYFAPSAFEAGFVSAMHTQLIIDQTLVCAQKAFTQLALHN